MIRNNVPRIAIIVSYYLSRFDHKAYNQLHFGNTGETHKQIGNILNVKESSIKNYRDIFDPYYDNPRRGWVQYKLGSSEKEIMVNFQEFNFEDITSLILEVLKNSILYREEENIYYLIKKIKFNIQSNLFKSKNITDANDYSGKNIKREVNQRQGQEQFRQKVLDNFRNRCCLTGEQNIRLLEASHIIPWSIRLDTQLDPRNGLCLSWIYHKLFDEGYFTIDNHLIVHISNQSVKLCDLNKYLLNIINGTEIQKPIQYNIHPEYLEYHRNHIFKHL
ncbi:HNH endonuclease [Lyngbya sp. PCC 8106]|uniref:HNH endonuclease n=1 Tax=Lyngbya sp. (strain PCC 8106) TaxID=313612 RepID=UPI0000EA99B4|nr:HNH endonuclease [Lyngbya sp. PCC 8106]EAW36863.1 hypothetical protein L8106_26917 [Lyngbya sp. PCC 8106]